jgi:glycosyltransferase involved in cell wall biosynthesis
MDSPLKASKCVDVVIPVFNGRETIESALSSVLEQQGGYVNKIIVVDDGSSDDTAQIVQKISNPMIELVRTDNQGVAKARNLGVERSISEWIAFLDADDIWIKDKLEAQITVALENHAGFVCGSASLKPVMQSGLFDAKLLAHGNFVATSSVLVRRSILKQLNPVFTPSMSFAEDYLVWLKCVSLTPGYYLSTNVVNYVLSEFPRYSWRQIFKSMIILNINYERFLDQSGIQKERRMEMSFALFMGTMRSILSISKRFMSSYFKGNSIK